MFNDDAFDFSREAFTVVRDYRLSKEWTQSELAAKLGLKQPDISLMERGLQPITRSRAEKLAEVFEVDAAIFTQA